jgi:hypothetical protein
MHNLTKSKIKLLVEEYQRVFPEEYAAFQQGQRVRVDLTSDKYASVIDGEALEQHLTEMPETLYTILEKHLSNDQHQELQTKEGMRWFARTFKQYAVAQAI